MAHLLKTLRVNEGWVVCGQVNVSILCLCSLEYCGCFFSNPQAGHLMTFYVGHNLELLFDSWQINTAEGKHHLLTLHLKFLLTYTTFCQLIILFLNKRKDVKRCRDGMPKGTQTRYRDDIIVKANIQSLIPASFPH